MNYTLPTTQVLGGVEYEIRSDFRAALDICAALSDPNLTNQEKAEDAIIIFYPQYEEIPPEELKNALDACFSFLSCGENSSTKNKVKLMDWEQDFNYIVPAVNRILGKEIRELPYLHWWTFIGAYNEIGDCVFSQIVAIRDKKSKGKKLDKQEQEWYRRNREIVDFKRQYTDSERETLEKLGLK